MNQVASFILNILQGHGAFVKEASLIAYGDDFVSFPDEKDLLRAHLVVELIEIYRYPPESLVVGAYVPIKYNGIAFTEVDLIVHNAARQPFILIAVEQVRYYEQRLEETVRKLFAVAILMRQKYPPRYLAYYTRWYEGERRIVRKVVIDYSKYQTFYAWHEASRPIVSDIPSNG